MKINLVDLKESLLVQNDIILALISIYDNISRTGTQEEKRALDSIKENIEYLDRNNYISLDDLLNSFSKKFKLYEINLKILFILAKKRDDIDKIEILENYRQYFAFIYHSNFNSPYGFPAIVRFYYLLIFSLTTYS